MKKTLFRRFICLLAVMLLAVSMIPTAAAVDHEHNHSDYASESIMPRSPICMNCGGRGRITERVTENADGYGECPYGNSAHHKEVMRGYYYCESCNEHMGSTIVARRIVCADCNFGNHWTYL